MTVLVYGITEASGAPLDVTGLDRRPLREITVDSLAAIVGDHAGAPPEPAIGALQAYEQAVRQLMDERAILPAQFGSVMADDGAVRAMLRHRHADLLARLDQVRGAVELALRAVWLDGGDGTSEQPSESGTEYLRRRMDRRQHARKVAGDLDPLKELARGCRRALIPRPELPVLDAYLVDRGRVDEFVALVEELDGRIDDVELVCTGPWPPYSFAEGAPV